jgi:hypothetical protein
MKFKDIALVVLITLFFFGDSHVYPFVGGLFDKTNQVTIVLEKPADNYIKETAPVARLITNKEDRLDLCLINLEFSNRMNSYLNRNVNSQHINDIYVGVNREFFNTRLRNKYDGLSGSLLNLISKTVGSDVRNLTAKDLEELNRYFLALSWNLENAS